MSYVPWQIRQIYPGPRSRSELPSVGCDRNDLRMIRPTPENLQVLVEDKCGRKLHVQEFCEFLNDHPLGRTPVRDYQALLEREQQLVQDFLKQRGLAS